MTVKNAYAAEAWCELFAAEGLSLRVIPPINRGESESMLAPRVLYVPSGKAHVAREILRKV